MRELQNNKPRAGTIEEMILTNLGYCCLQAFFSLYPATSLVAARLGVASRNVRALKARVANEGKGKCNNCAKCLKGRKAP